MRSKCSFILKALTAMVLVVLLLFGTVATSFAAVVRDLATTGATTTYYVYFTPDNWTGAAYYRSNYCWYYNSDSDNGWRNDTAVIQSGTVNGNPVYKVAVRLDYGGMRTFQIQGYADSSFSTWKGQYTFWENNWTSFDKNGQYYDGTSWHSTWSYDTVLTKLTTPSLKYNNSTSSPVTLASGQTASLSWANVANASGYAIYKNSSQHADSATSPYDAGLGKWTVVAKGDGTTYSNSDPSNEIWVKTTTKLYVKKSLADTTFKKIHIWSNTNDKWTGAWPGELITGWSTASNNSDYYYKEFVNDYEKFKFILNNDSSPQTSDSEAYDTGKTYYIDEATKDTQAALIEDVPAVKYNVSVAAGITGGTVSVSPERAAAGETITVTVSPNTGFEVGTVTYSGNNTITITNGEGTFTMPAGAVEVNATFPPIRRTVSFKPYYTNDNSTYSLGGSDFTAALSAAYATSSGGGGGQVNPSAPARYLWWSGSNNPETHTNKIDMVADTNGNYYADFNPGNANFYFNINDSSTSATDGSQKLNSSTSCDKGDGVADWSTVDSWSGHYIGKGYLSSGTTLYVKFDPNANKVTMQNTAFSYTAEGGSGGGSGTSGSVSDGGTVPYGSDVTYTAEVVVNSSGETYQFVGWYAASAPVANETALSTNVTYTVNNVTSNPPAVYARYKKSLYLTLYNSYMRENASSPWKFVAAPPRTVVVGDGTDTRATYTYKAGNSEQRGENHTKNSTADYYEGNRLLVLVGETVTLNFSSLASSDVIRGLFFNNSIRYTTETEPDNLYLNRVNHGTAAHGGNGTGTLKDSSDPSKGYATGDDDWEYDYLPATTIFADENYYTGTPKATIHNNNSSYVAHDAMNQTTHSISWVAYQSYLNIDCELDYKKQITINNDDWKGLTVTGLNTEGFYYTTEQVGKIDENGTELKIQLNNSDSTRTFAFNGTNTVLDAAENGNSVAGFTIKAYDSSDVEVTPISADTASSISYYLISCSSMPGQNVWINIGVDEQFNMKLGNLVISDTIDHKMMLTQTNQNVTTAPAEPSDYIGTITALKNKSGNSHQGDISSDGVYWVHNGTGNASYKGKIFNSNGYSNSFYLNGGVNIAGSVVKAGDAVTYSFTFAPGKDALYSFVGWFEGTYSDNKFTPNYSKKLSPNQSFTYNPEKNTVVIAVATRDIYLGGNFDSAGTYSESDTTWSQKRIRMSFDPTYVNGSNHGRYYYEFPSITTDVEYKFRCYDTKGTGAEGEDKTNLVAWTQWDNNGTSSEYAEDHDDIHFGRDKYAAADGYSHGQFIFKTNTTSHKLSGNDAANSTSTKNHQANGYGDPVTVYFYAYDGGISVSSTYQWSMAYVSAGAGVDCINYSEITNKDDASYNTPTVSVANKTAGYTGTDNNVETTTQSLKYGNNNRGNHPNYEQIIECMVKMPNGKIVVEASPADENLELQAFVCYNIDTKDSWAIYDFSPKAGVSNTWTADIEIPQNSKIYIVPVYKFTSTFISTNNLKSHIVYVLTDDIDKDEWGGLVSMYSWGTKAASGVWPGQLMIPTNDHKSFYAPLTFDDLSGVTFNNYAKIYDTDWENTHTGGANFLSTYAAKGVSSKQYSGHDNTRIYQAYDYREPISIINNIQDQVYGTDEMTLTFALKPGNKGENNTSTGGASTSNSYSAGYSWEYLTDRSGKKRVDLNGNSAGNGTATYYVVCNYTEEYAAGTESYAPATEATGRYSIDWTVYNVEGVYVAGGRDFMSAAYADVVTEDGGFMTVIADAVIRAGQPVDGKAVMIAYENPQISNGNDGAGGTLAEAVRYSGQWYTDGVNTIIDVSVDIGIYVDEVYQPSGSSTSAFASGSVDLVSGTTAVSGENFSSAHPAKVTIKHATDMKVQLSVDTSAYFMGWYTYDEKANEYKLESTDQTFTPSFNTEITFYAFYNAEASYTFKYKDRHGNYKNYVVNGKDVSPEEMGNGGQLNAASRTTDIAQALKDVPTTIKVFNRSFTYNITTPDAENAPYNLTFTDEGSEPVYTLTVMGYNDSGVLVQNTTVTGKWSATNPGQVNLDPSIVSKKPADHSNWVFQGWKKYNGSAVEGEILSTQANYGYCITQNMTIAPVFGESRITDNEWKAYVDKTFISQELTSPTTGKLYADNLISFRYASETGRELDYTGSAECGIIIVAQTAAGTLDPTMSASFTGLTEQSLQGYMRSLAIPEGKTYKGGKISAMDAYAYRIKATTLSNMNRVDLYQAFDYAKFNGGRFKVMSYYYDGSKYVYSDMSTGNLTLTPAA